MIALLKIYFWPLAAGVFSAPALALLGAQLAARDRAMQTLCVGQGATLGVLCGLGVLQLAGAPDLVLHLGPFASAVLFSVATYLVSKTLAEKYQASKNTFFCAVFALLLGLGYLVCAIFPGLENHMTQVFFGDLATLSNFESGLAVGLACVCLLFFGYSWRAISYQSFQLSVFGKTKSPSGSWNAVLFDILAIGLLAFSVQFLGFLFTISSLFIPTVLAKRIRSNSLPLHLTLITLLSSFATFAGFLLSLTYSRLPTVPTVLLVTTTLGIGFPPSLRFERFRKSLK